MDFLLLTFDEFDEGSEATRFYLKLMHYLTSAMLDKSLSILERDYRIWFAVASFRAWRYWIMHHETYTLQQNFITLNVYLCAEVNAHSLILISLKLREENIPASVFQPWKFDSQTCESYFRMARSFTPMESTQVNFSMMDFRESRCRKVDTAILLATQGPEDGIIYPRARRQWKMDDNHNQDGQQIPALEEIEAVVLRAMADAKKELASLGIF